jgi:hypothetical protein
MTRAAFCAVLLLVLAGCQTSGQPGVNPPDRQIDPACAQKKIGTRLLAKATGLGLGAVGVPGGGLIARGVGYAADPGCQLLVPRAAEKASTKRGAASPAAVRE